VDILFATNKLRSRCNDDAAARKKWGTECAKKLRVRLDDLRAASTLNEVAALPGKFEELSGDLKGQFSLRLHGGVRLLLEPAQDPPPRKADGGLDLRGVTSVRILNVEDYHRG